MGLGVVNMLRLSCATHPMDGGTTTTYHHRTANFRKRLMNIIQHDTSELLCEETFVSNFGSHCFRNDNQSRIVVMLDQARRVGGN